jgi:FMN reductase
MTTRTIAVVSAGLSKPSSTRMLADRLGESVADQLRLDGDDVTVRVVELRDIAQDITNNLLTGFPSASLADAIETVRASDGLVAVTPIFSASYSGLFKSFFDVIEPDALRSLPVLLAATGGTARHSLAIDFAMRPLFSYLHATVASTGVFAATDDWGASGDNVATLPDRVAKAATEFAGLIRVSTRSKDLVDPWALPPL